MFARKSNLQNSNEIRLARTGGGYTGARRGSTQNDTNEQRSSKKKARAESETNNKIRHKSFAIFICLFTLRFLCEILPGAKFIYIFGVCGSGMMIKGEGSVVSERVWHLFECPRLSVCVFVRIYECCVRMSGHKGI